MRTEHLPVARFVSGEAFDAPISKVVCVGRNYAAHARELGNAVPDQPIYFIKPASSVTWLEAGIDLPAGLGSVHHEAEIAVLIGETLSGASEEEAVGAIAGLGVGLDLTLRDVQGDLKAKGHPWERAKGMDGLCPLGPFASLAGREVDLGDLHIRFAINGQIRQQGSSAQMLFPIATLLADMSHLFTLYPGDVVLTGTPEGVGPLAAGDELELTLENWVTVRSSVR
ncbi:MAG: fumarylacetoacetate hydrolase family protein [Gammaproteobacteria bacterium]|nr:MAG: fumarylacetoacetate hydrolase family protein [Gammaproteobacteria bacterium]